MLRLIVAAIVGYFLGYERKKHDKSGGCRTMALVSIGACLIAILTQKIVSLNPETQNFTRLMAYGISGMGFIGTGVIWKFKGNIEGLTTAATLFLLMPIGYCFGLGFWFEAFAVSLITFFILESKYWDINKTKGIK